MRIALIVLTALLTTPAHAATPTPIERLVTSMAERLAVADQVALTKWDSGKAVEDKPRERQVTEAASQLAAQYQVNPEWAAQFFSAQIEANKLVQYAHLAAWAATGNAPATQRPDLIKDIRPALDTLQKTLLANLAAVDPLRSSTQCQPQLTAAINAHAADELHRLALVRASAELCVTLH